MDHLRRALQEYAAHYNEHRPHRRLGNELGSGSELVIGAGKVTKSERLGGLLNSYRRAG